MVLVFPCTQTNKSQEPNSLPSTISDAPRSRNLSPTVVLGSMRGDHVVDTLQFPWASPWPRRRSGYSVPSRLWQLALSVLYLNPGSNRWACDCRSVVWVHAVASQRCRDLGGTDGRGEGKVDVLAMCRKRCEWKWGVAWRSCRLALASRGSNTSRCVQMLFYRGGGNESLCHCPINRDKEISDHSLVG
jgi:hypothetical protein